jgi:hypothetical protein
MTCAPVEDSLPDIASRSFETTGRSREDDDEDEYEIRGSDDFRWRIGRQFASFVRTQQITQGRNHSALGYHL